MPGCWGHSGALPCRGYGRGRAGWPGTSEVPRKALPGGAKLAGNRLAKILFMHPLSPSFPLSQPTSLHRLLSRPLPGATNKRAPMGACVLGLGCASPCQQHLECLCLSLRPAEAPCPPQPTTRSDNKADVHHVACSFQEGQILTSVSQVEAYLGHALWAPLAPTFI